MRILAKADDKIQLDPVNGTSLQLCFLDFFPYVAVFFVSDHVWIHRIS